MDGNCHVEPIQKAATTEEQQMTTTVVLAIGGMGCPNCAARVRNSLVSLHGVVDAHVALELGVAEVTFNPNLTDRPALISAVAQAGGDGRHTYRAQTYSGPGVQLGYRD